MVCLFTSDPQPSRVSMQSVLFQRHAECRGVQPSSVMAVISAPDLKSIFNDIFKKKKIYYFFRKSKAEYGNLGCEKNVNSDLENRSGKYKSPKVCLYSVF